MRSKDENPTMTEMGLAEDGSMLQPGDDMDDGSIWTGNEEEAEDGSTNTDEADT